MTPAATAGRAVIRRRTDGYDGGEAPARIAKNAIHTIKTSGPDQISRAGGTPPGIHGISTGTRSSTGVTVFARQAINPAAAAAIPLRTIAWGESSNTPMRAPPALVKASVPCDSHAAIAATAATTKGVKRGVRSQDL